MKPFLKTLFSPHDFMHTVPQKYFYTLLPFRGCEGQSR